MLVKERVEEKYKENENKVIFNILLLLFDTPNSFYLF